MRLMGISPPHEGKKTRKIGNTQVCHVALTCRITLVFTKVFLCNTNLLIENKVIQY